MFFSSFQNLLSDITGCEGVTRVPQDPLFHAACTVIALSYLVPNTLNAGRVILHSGLIIGFLICSAWAWNVLCAPEIFAWNFVFIVVNAGQLLYVLYQMRPIKFPDDVEHVYTTMFRPFKVPRALFQRLIAPDMAQIVELHTGECYAVKDLSKTVCLGILLSGKVHVTNEKSYLHDIQPTEFLDSPEYESSGFNCEETFKVTVVAAIPSRCLAWQRSALEYLFIKEPYLSTVMSTLVSRDITNKIYSMNKKLYNGEDGWLDVRLPGIVGRISRLSDKELSKLAQIDDETNRARNKRQFVKSFRKRLNSPSIKV